MWLSKFTCLQKRVLLLKKSKMTLKLYTTRPHEWQLQAYVYEDFLYTSRNSSLPREGAWYLTGQDENVSRKGKTIRPIRTPHCDMAVTSPILSVIGYW